MKKLTLTKVAQFGLVAAVVFAPMIALALAVPTPPVGGEPVTLRTIGDIIQQIVQFLIVISVVIAVGAIIWGGILWMIAGGNDDRVEQAKKTVTRGILGAAVVLAVGVILQTLSSVINRNFFQ